MKDNKYILQAMGMYSTKYGGIERYMVEMTRALTQLGYTTIFTYNATPQPKEYISDIEAAGGKIIIVEYNGFFKTIKKLSAIIKEYKPVVVHSHFRYREPLIAALCHRIKRSYASLHCLHRDNVSLNINDYSNVERLYWKTLPLLSAKFYSVSQAVFNQAKVLMPKSTIIENIYLGIELNNFVRDEARQKLNYPNEDMILLSNISFDVGFKSIDVLLQGVAILKHEYKMVNFRLLHFGIDPLSESGIKWRNYAQSLDVDDVVEWRGVVNNIPELLPGIDIYVHPSKAEALGLVIMEAGAASVPVVASNVGGMKDVVVDGVSGSLFQVGQADQMALKIKELIKHPELRKQMGVKGKQIVAEKFNIKKQVQKMIKSYQINL